MTVPTIAEVPNDGVWRVGRSQRPLEFRLPAAVGDVTPGGGNRFDSYLGSYGTIYFGDTLEVCYAETLARFRPNPDLANLVGDEWRDKSWMDVGALPADWRHGRVASRCCFPGTLPIVDINSPDTIAYLNDQAYLRAALAMFGVTEIDLGSITGGDRRITRFIAQFLFDERRDDGFVWSGIRYTSRLGEGWRCWAIFDGAPVEEIERISILQSDAALQAVCDKFHLKVF